MILVNLFTIVVNFLTVDLKYGTHVPKFGMVSCVVVSKNKTVMRSKELLELFLAQASLTLPEMVRLSGIPKSSVHRMLGSLEEMGFVERSADGSYRLGLLFLQYGQLVAERLDVRQVARPYMMRLRDEVDEAVNLILPDGDCAIYIEKMETDKPVRVYTRIGRRAPLYAGACPRILLAHWSEEQLEAYLQRVELVPIARGTLTDKGELRQVLAEARANGYAISHSELEDYSSALAAPIFDHAGCAVAGISLAGPEARFQQDDLGELAEKLKRTALSISRELGYQG